MIDDRTVDQHPQSIVDMSGLGSVGIVAGAPGRTCDAGCRVVTSPG